MKAAVVVQPGTIQIRDVKDPQIDDYEAVLKMKACGLCNSTDLKILHGKFPGVTNYPLILGHEGVGQVVDVGTKVQSFRGGDMVLEPWAKIRDEGLSAGYGAFVEYAVVRDQPALARDGLQWNPVLLRHQIVPEDIDPVEAVILITLKETLSGLMNFGFKTGMNVLVFGDGPVGVSLVRFARLLGADLIVGVGHWDERLQLMKSLGADHVVNGKNEKLPGAIRTAAGDRRFDLAIDAVGKNRIVNEALRLVRDGGKVGMYGVSSEPEFTTPLSSWPNDVSLHKLFFPARHEEMHDRVIDYVTQGALRLKDFYSHILSLDEIETAVELVSTRKAFKVIVKFD